MAGLLDWFSGGGSADLYGDLLSERQRGGIGNRGLLALAASLGKNAGPSFSPVPDFGAALGQAAGAYGAGSDKAAETVFEGGYKGAQAKQLLSQIEYAKQLAPLLGPLSEAIARLNAGGGVPGGGGPLAAPGAERLPGIRGPLAAPAGGVARGLPGLLLPEIKTADLGGEDSGTAKFPDPGSIDYPATDPSGLAAGGALRRQASATPALSVDLAPYQTGGLLAPQPADLPQLANYAVGNAVPGGPSPITGVAPQMSNRIEAMLAGMPPDILQKFNVLSGYRSPERQAVVNPGVTNSRHTAGTAVDTTTDPAVLDWVRQNGPQYGVGYTLAGMPGEANHLEMLGAGGGRPDTVVPSAGGLPVQTAGLLSGSAREIADNNFGGMRRPGVIATPGQGGFQAFATPAEGLAAISNQLDRYASGATTGKPLTTIRQIVSTWAPPNENPTETLIARASRIVGVDPDQQIDVSNPAVKAKLIEATIRNEQGGKLPVDPGLIEQAANASPGTVTGGPDTVVPTGDRPSLPVARTQYAPAQGGLLAPGVLPGTAAAALPQVNPAYGDVLAQIARLRVMSELAGMKNDPLAALTGALKDSPAYQAQIELAKRLGVFPLIGPEAAARTTAERGAAEPFNIREETLKADLQRRNAAAAQGFTLDDKGNAVPIPEYDKVQALIEFSKEAGKSAGGLPAAVELKTKEARIMLDSKLAEKGQYAIYDDKGRPTIISGIQGANETAAAQAGAVEQAQADARARADIAKQREQVGSIDPIKARNEVLAGEYKETVSAADAASKAKVPLTQIENAMPDFRTGQTAQTRLGLAKTWQDFAANIGLPPNSDLARMIASGEIINKSGTTLGFELARTLGSREAQNIVQQAVAANPGLAVSPGGNKELIGLIKQGLQRDIDKREYFDNHFRQYGSYDRAATEFNRTNPVEKYVSQILPYTVATPADAAKLPPGTRFKSPNDPSGLVRTVPER